MPRFPRRLRRLAPAAAALALGALAAPAPAQPAAAAPPVRVTSVEGITEYRLSNGLRVLLFPDASKPTATVNITYFVGSAKEGYGETGMAHLLEHMVFKGSPRHTNIPQELTAHGARPNGTTWLERTNYFETIPAVDTTLAWALDLEADRMVNSYIADKDLRSEFSVVRNEFEMGENSPFNVTMERAMSAAFLWHGYGRSTIGNRSDIENVPITRLQAFYHKYYQPDNAMLVVAGKFDEPRTLALIAEKFGRIPRPARALEPSYTVEPTQDGERTVTVRRVGDVQLAFALYHIPPAAHADYPAVAVLGEVLGSEPSGRLYQALVVPKRASSAGAWSYEVRDPGILIAFTQVRREDSLAVAQRVLLATLDSAGRTAPTAAEVDRAKTALLTQWDLTFNNSERVALDLSESAAAGDWRLLFVQRDRIKQVTPADVQRVAAAYLKPANRTTALFVPTAAPDRAEVPVTPNIDAIVGGYKGNAAVAAGEAFDPSPANVDARTTRTRLASGLQLALLPKKTRGGTVTAAFTLRTGDEASLQGRRAAAELTAQMILRGTKALTRQQVKDSLDKLKANVYVYGGPTEVGGGIETTRENLPAVLRLVGQSLREPALDAKEFELLKSEQLAQLDEQRSEPTALGSIAYQRALHPHTKGHPLYTPTLDERGADVRALTADDVRRFHRDFYGASAGELSVVGDFDRARVAALADSLFATWKSATPFRRVPVPYAAVAAGTQSILTPDKANAFFLAGTNLRLRDDDPDYPALVLANYMLGGGFLNSRLATRIRQKEGISYGVGSQFQASALDSAGGFTTYAIYAPQNVDRLEKAFREEIARAEKEGFTADEVAQAKAGWLQNRQTTRARDAALARALGQQLYLGRTTAWDAGVEARVQALTPDQVRAALARAVDPAKVVIVKAGDWSNKTQAAAVP
ncbi:peptidase M16 [Gemmatimonadetes bacterium T265]|nr:peptidase M16 [Gemmatimonadetes bacterium T265]